MACKSTVKSLAPTTNGRISLKVLQITVIGATGIEMRVGCLLDGGSHRSYVTEEIAAKLELKCCGKERMRIHTFGGNVINHTLKRRILTVKGLSGEKEKVEMLGKEVICESVELHDPGHGREVPSDQHLSLAFDTAVEEQP